MITREPASAVLAGAISAENAAGAVAREEGEGE